MRALLIPIATLLIAGCSDLPVPHPMNLTDHPEGWFKRFSNDLYYCRSNPVPNSPFSNPTCVEAKWMRTKTGDATAPTPATP